MTRRLFPFLCAAFLAVNAGCIVGAGENRQEPTEEDGGSILDCVDDGEDCRFSEVEPPINACNALVATTCGAGDGPSCADSTACYAAQLLAQYEEASCDAALDDEGRFPACGFSTCETLVQHVCGGLDPNAPCEQAAGCDPARTLLDRSRLDDDALSVTEALQTCRAALEDDVVFAACTE